MSAWKSSVNGVVCSRGTVHVRVAEHLAPHASCPRRRVSHGLRSSMCSRRTATIAGRVLRGREVAAAGHDVQLARRRAAAAVLRRRVRCHDDVVLPRCDEQRYRARHPSGPAGRSGPGPRTPGRRTPGRRRTAPGAAGRRRRDPVDEARGEPALRRHSPPGPVCRPCAPARRARARPRGPRAVPRWRCRPASAKGPGSSGELQGHGSPERDAGVRRAVRPPSPSDPADVPADGRSEVRRSRTGSVVGAAAAVARAGPSRAPRTGHPAARQRGPTAPRPRCRETARRRAAVPARAAPASRVKARCGLSHRAGPRSCEAGQDRVDEPWGRSEVVPRCAWPPRSASSSSAAASARACIAAASTSSTDRRARPPGTPRRHRQLQEAAQRRPLAVPRAVGPLVDRLSGREVQLGSRAAAPGARRCGRARSGPGCACGAWSTSRRGLATNPSRTSPISGRESSATSEAMTPSASQAPTRASPTRVTGRAVGVPRAVRASAGRARRRRPRATATGSAARSPTRESVPAAPPHWTGRTASASSSCSPASRTPDSHWAALRPKVIGHGVLGERSARHDRLAVPLGQRRQRASGRGEVGSDARQRVAGEQHQGGVEHVLAGQPTVDDAGEADRRRRAARSASTSGHDGVPGRLGVRRASASGRRARRRAASATRVDVLGRRPRRPRPGPAARRPRPAASRATSAASSTLARRAVRHRATAVRGRRSSRPCPGKVRKTVSRSPCRCTSKRRLPSCSRAATSVCAALGGQPGQERVATRRRPVRAGRRG